MEDWQLDFEWLKVRHQIKEIFNRDNLPDLNAILLLIGIQESGHIKSSFTKEEKQDLMHIAVCTLLSYDGYYEFEGLDQDGWPHFKVARSIPKLDVKAQERLLKEKSILYFEKQGMK